MQHHRHDWRDDVTAAMRQLGYIQFVRTVLPDVIVVSLTPVRHATGLLLLRRNATYYMRPAARSAVHQVHIIA